jgi:hypothetical protein
MSEIALVRYLLDSDLKFSEEFNLHQPIRGHMTTQVMQGQYVKNEVNERRFTNVERYFLMHSHPRTIVLDLVAMIWATYFLWEGNWPVAVSAIFLLRGLGLYVTRNIDPERMASTTLGRLGLLHLEPVNVALNAIGSIPLVYGIWAHSVEYILGGVSVVILGHFFGWSKVNGNL